MPSWPLFPLRLFHPEPAPPRPSRTLFFWLIGAFVLTLLPQVEELPLWVSVVVVGALVIRALLEIYRLPLPSTLFTALLALCLLAAVLLQFQGLFGREATTSLMAGLMAIKFYELRGPRDVSVIIFSSLFIVMSALLYSQALELFIYCLIMMWLLTATLLRNSMGDHPDHHLLPMLGRAGLILIQALPLALVLFFFFPRYNGKLQIVLDESPMGITDRVAPGSVARLASNDSEAMYVKFTSVGVPSPETMYWRGLVLWDYHDGVWTPGQMAANPGVPLKKDTDSTTLDEVITILPHNQKWLFALDYPYAPAVNKYQTGVWIESQVLSGGVLQLGPADGRVDHTERYDVTSASQLLPLKATLQLASPSEYNAGRQIDRDSIDPQVVALADRLHAANPEPEAYVVAVLHYFHESGFTYTTSPGNAPSGDAWLPYFLFTSKAGYCEYFASAFAVLMRLEGVPSRVVVGYQGATYNPYDDTYHVLQSDAHAWDEVWNDATRRWRRVDPTALLPPGESNLATANGNAAQENKPLRVIPRTPSFLETHLPEWVNHTLTDLGLRREEIEVGWDDWVFSYTPDSQTTLARAFGFGRWALAVVSAGAMLFCFLVFRRYMRRREVISPVENLYARFCRSMAQRGVPRAKWEGPLAYTDRVAETLPEKKEAIHHFGDIVARSRYGPSPVGPATPKELQALLDQIAASQAAASSSARE